MRLRMLLIALLLAIVPVLILGCGPTRGRGGGGGGGGGSPGGGGGDGDEDGLSEDFEDLIGTSDELADTDGDGYDDGDEYLAYFDPADDTDYPYEGDYPRGPLPEDIDSDGWAEGDVSMDWGADDQFGQELRLHRFYGNVILVDMSAEWCGPCRAAAETLQAEYQERKDEGFVVLQLLLDGYDPGAPPDVDRWIGDFGLTLPVISDHDLDIAQHYIPAGGGSFGIPNFTVLDRELQIVDHYVAGGEPNWSLIDSLLAEEPPEVDWPMPE